MFKNEVNLGSFVKRQVQKSVGIVIEFVCNANMQRGNVIWQNGSRGLYPVTELGAVVEMSRPSRESKHNDSWIVNVDYGVGNIYETGSKQSMDFLYKMEEKYFG